MTKTSNYYGKRIGFMPPKEEGKFNEKFPQRINTLGLRGDTSARSSLCLDQISTSLDSSLSEKEEKKLRRHTWTQGLMLSDLDDVNILSSFHGLSLERRCSSSSSVHETIEEDEEETKDEEDGAHVDYIKCKNCTQNENWTIDSSLESMENMNYCFNCRHLVKKKMLPGLPKPGLFDQSTGPFDSRRRGLRSCGDKKKKRESSLQSPVRGSLDLFPISDETVPSEDDKEEIEVRKRVEDEVEKLIRFNSKNMERRGTIGCEKEFKKTGLMKIFRQSSRSLDLEYPPKSLDRAEKISTLNGIRPKKTTISIKKQFMFQ